MLLGIDLGTSSVKVSVVDVQSQNCIASVQYPETEIEIISKQTGWAEQSPNTWWENVRLAILKLHAQNKYDPHQIKAIGIAYQMHGLVLVDKKKQPLRNSIIWCDSRAVSIGKKAFQEIGEKKCLSHLLNSPGNFTASKLAWVKKNEPKIYEKIHKIMLPGDFIAMKLTGEITTTVSSLSEGIFWDFKKKKLSKDILNYFGFDTSIFPEIKNVFEDHGRLLNSVAEELRLTPGIKVSYKAGDQPNNALSLHVTEPGEVAATAGTSGVVYAITDELFFDKQSRVNTFAHVNYTDKLQRLGILLCINGTGIMNNWIKKITGNVFSYKEMNTMAASVSPGSDGLMCFPFGNGAERIFNDKLIHSHFNNIDLNLHSPAHLFRSVQEGIVFSFKYGVDIMKENNLQPSVIKAGHANLFLSDVFAESFSNATGCTVELYNTDGSLGAARAAGIGAGIYSSISDAFKNMKMVKSFQPNNKLKQQYKEIYHLWKSQLQKLI